MPKYFIRKTNESVSEEKIQSLEDALAHTAKKQEKLSKELDETNRRLSSIQDTGAFVNETEASLPPIEDDMPGYIPMADLRGEAEITISSEKSKSNLKEVEELKKKNLK